MSINSRLVLLSNHSDARRDVNKISSKLPDEELESKKNVIIIIVTISHAY